MKRIFSAFACVALCLIASCSGSYYKSPMLASTKAAVVPPHKVLGKVESKDCAIVYNFMLFFPIPVPTDFKKMYNGVLEQAREMGGDAVIDFQVRETSIYSAFFFYMKFCYSATGTAVRFTTDGTSAWDAPPVAEEQKQDTKSVWDLPKEEL